MQRRDDQLAVCLKGAKARLQGVQRIFGPISRLPTLSNPPHEFLLTSDESLALGDVLVGLRKVPMLLIRHCLVSHERAFAVHHPAGNEPFGGVGDAPCARCSALSARRS